MEKTFETQARALREKNKRTFAFSTQASQELAENNNVALFTEDEWDTFWEILQEEYLRSIDYEGKRFIQR